MTNPILPQTETAAEKERVQTPSHLATNKENETSDKHLAGIKGSGIFRDVPEILGHTVTLVLALISIWILHLLLGYLLGKEAKFFDWIPIRFVFEAADLILVLKFLWHLIKGFNK